MKQKQFLVVFEQYVTITKLKRLKRGGNGNQGKRGFLDKDNFH